MVQKVFKDSLGSFDVVEEVSDPNTKSFIGSIGNATVAY